MTDLHIQARNPRTGRIDFSIAACEVAELQVIAGDAREAQTTWAGKSAHDRAQCMLALADALEARREKMLDALLDDTGRWNESVLEVDGVLAAMRRWAERVPTLLAASDPRPANVPFIQIEQQVQPYALVGVISPWNFPLLLSMIDAIPALLAGCAIIIKPSEVTPRFIEPLREAIAAVPDMKGILHVVAGAGEIGAALIDLVDLVCFTGSVRTGRRVGEACAAKFIPAFLELGGKDPALVLDDADIPRAARAIAWGGLVNAGQSCMSIERVYVERSVADQFVGELVECASSLRLNTLDARDGQVGPIISEAQADILRRQFDDAATHGAKALCGGHVVEHDGGLWCEPTILVDVTEHMLVMHEETFGAVIAVCVVDDEEAAITAANSTEFGLSAAVFSADIARAKRIANRLQAGAISINDAALTSIVHNGEKQSFKKSGLGGSRMGDASLRRFLRQQALLINSGVDDPWWF